MTHLEIEAVRDELAHPVSDEPIDFRQQEYLVGSLLAHIDEQANELKRLREVLREIWCSVPATYADETDPMVHRHAHALNAIPAALEMKL